MCEICNNPLHHSSEPLPQKNDGRRDFLKWAGVAALGLLLPGCGPDQVNPNTACFKTRRRTDRKWIGDAYFIARRNRLAREQNV